MGRPRYQEPPRRRSRIQPLHTGDDVMLTLAEVAARLRISRAQAHNMVMKKRLLKFVNVSLGKGKRQHPRVRLSDLNAFITSRMNAV